MQIALPIIMFVFGAAIGSFLCCQVRRLHERELNHKKLGPRSICLHCHRQLKWYDNIPLFSWCMLRGRCRYCHHKIGFLEIASELGLALAFLAITLRLVLTTHAYYPQFADTFLGITAINWGIFAITLLLIISLGFLAIYDGAYGELPSFCLCIALICAIILAVVQGTYQISETGFDWSRIIMPLASALVLGGIYLALYLVSRGRWVGDGDWLLGTAIGIALGHPFLALIALLIANLSATIVSAPTVKKRGSEIHFGPFLVFAFVVTYTFSDFFISMI